MNAWTELSPEAKALQYAEQVDGFSDPIVMKYADEYRDHIAALAKKFDGVISTHSVVRQWFTPGEVIMYAHKKHGVQF